MAKRVRDATLDSRAARERLKVRGKPYYRQIERGLHLGYRRLKGKAGSWMARHYTGEQQYEVEGLGTADDFSDADGHTILTFDQAVTAARERMAARARVGEGRTAAALTVREAVEAYIVERDERDSKRRGRQVRSDAAHRLCRYVLGQEARGQSGAMPEAPLARVELHRLEDSELSDWLEGLPEAMMTATRKRMANDLRAALNRAYTKHRKQLPATLPATIKHGLRVENGEDDDPVARDNQILTDLQVTRLLRAAREIDAEQDWDGDLFRMVVVLAATGARYSQVCRLRVRDCQPANSRLMVPASRKGKGKSGHIAVPVGQDTLDALQPAVTGRKGNAWLLERWRYRQIGNGKWGKVGRAPWQHSELTAPWVAIRERAGMPEVIAYALRHSSIVRGIRANLPLRLVAALHDTSTTMIEKHYSAYIVDGLEELAAKAVVPLVPQDDGGKVLPMRGR